VARHPVIGERPLAGVELGEALQAWREPGVRQNPSALAAGPMGTRGNQVPPGRVRLPPLGDESVRRAPRYLTQTVDAVADPSVAATLTAAAPSHAL
jgi:hypothetical protein